MNHHWPNASKTSNAKYMIHALWFRMQFSPWCLSLWNNSHLIRFECKNDFPVSVINFKSPVKTMPVFTRVMEILGSRWAKTSRNPWGAPQMLLQPPTSLPPHCLWLCAPGLPALAGMEDAGVRGTYALYSISLIRTGTTNKTGWSAKKHWDVPWQEAIIFPVCAWHATYG